MSLASKRLADAHRRAQVQIATEIVAQMRAIFPLLDPQALDASFHRWLAAAVPLVQAGRSTSARLAANYLAAHKTLELGPAAHTRPVLADHVDQRALHTSLLVTGPVSIKRAMLRSAPIEAAVRIAEVATAAAAMRWALNGGRETIVATLRADPQAQGWQRVTGGNSCAFCDDLAGRGDVYSADSADFQAHDGCTCSAEPVYAA